MKEKRNVKVAEKNMNEQTETSEVVSKIETQEVIPESLDEILSKVDKNQIEMVNNLVPGLIPYLRGQEAKMNYIAENALNKQSLIEMVEQQNAQNAQAMQNLPQPQPGQGGGQNLLQLLAMAGQMMGGGGGGNERMQKLQEDLLQTSIDSMKTDIGIGKALKNAIVSKMGAKFVGAALE